MKRSIAALLLFLCAFPFIQVQAQEAEASPEMTEEIPLYVPILMYHRIGIAPESADDIQKMLTLDPEIFAAHLEYLHEAGYTTISLYDLHDALENGTELPEKPIILTFDDGYLEHYESVFPLLQEYEMTATFFIVTDFLGDSGFMNWEQVIEMSEAGMSIEAHTKTHADLAGQDADFLEDEIMSNVDRIEEETGIRPRFLAYPYGSYDADTIAFLEETEFLGALTIQSGAMQSLDNRYEMPRLMVTNRTTVSSLRVLLSYR